ncbi:patatin-like phospholipase family protein [Rheinheimera sp.]|uniref:patatin-like phospholipase family protein n=1 Tax=Rheinheimera sp. TaxID=1869214 RepID=UPI00273683C7|nr:patatin-like phospholipase family protein [Rheinheimera sp.]MDP2714517.1 patatin-like phospholipase family protein [Rheinheimera sp.]
MKTGILNTLLAASLVCSGVALADDVCQQARAQNRDCVALVLGGGGARGGAHLGVIEQLERQQIPIDLVVGTSIGAFIGGLYASGHSAEQIAQRLERTPWAAGFRDRVYRDEMPLRRKQISDDFPVNTDLGVSADGVKLPKGILNGQALAEILHGTFGIYADLKHFNDLPVPFRAVATDLLTQQEVVLSNGSLVQAVQASMTIPGVVRPLELNGKLLVDGGVVNNLPISVARQLGVDRIIAVSIDSPLLRREQMESAFSVTEQLTSFLVRAGVQQQLQLLTDRDLLLQPDLVDISTLDFDRINVAVASGRQSAIRFVQALADFSQPHKVYSDWFARFDQASKPAIAIDRLQLQNNSRLADQLLFDRLELKPGDFYTERSIRRGLRQLYGLDTFERVSQQLSVEEDGSTLLSVKAEEKSWGPAYLNFRLMFEDDFRNNHQYQLAAAYTRTNLSPWGAEWHSELALGSNKYLSTELYWPLANSGLYSSAGYRHRRDVLRLQDELQLSAGELKNIEHELQLSSGWNISDHARLQLGWVWRDGEYQLPAVYAAELLTSRIDYRRSGPQAELIWDTLNSRSFPTRGIRLASSYRFLTDKVLGSELNSTSSSTELLAAKSWQQHTLRTRWRFDHYKPEDDTGFALEQFSLGGFLNLSGYPAESLFGSQIQFGSLVYLYRLNEQSISFINAPLYFGTSLERGRVRKDVFGASGGADATGWLWAGSVFLGWDTPLGPLYFGVGMAEQGQSDYSDAVYLSFGKNY